MWPSETIKADKADVSALPEAVKNNGSLLSVMHAQEQARAPEAGELESSIISKASAQRLDLHPVDRLFLIGGTCFAGGFLLGSYTGSITTSLRYRAENAHHTPTSKAGWFLYQKSQNYHAIVGGVKEGMKTGARFFGWAGLFITLEEGLDRARGRLFARRGEEMMSGQRDFLNTVSAAVAVAGIYAWRHKFDRFAASKLTSMTIRYSVPYGLLQDTVASLTGNRPWYADQVMRRTSYSAQSQEVRS